MFRRKLTSLGLSDEPRRAASVRPASSGIRLLWVADAVLAVVPLLRAAGFVSNLARLRAEMASLLRDFHARARIEGIEARRVAQATEVLAALIDHVVTSMPWGADAGWESLGVSPPSSTNNQRTAAGVVQRLLAVARMSSSDVGMRELIGVGLALGFDERSGGVDSAQIGQLRAQLAAHVPKDGGRAEHELSPQWQSFVTSGTALASWLPLWVSGLVVVALLAVLFFSLELSLGARSDRVYARMAALNGPRSMAPRSLPAPQPRLAGDLSQEVAAQKLLVRDELDRSIIVVPDVQLFEAHTATLLPPGVGLLRSIAAALQGSPGRIQVVGHTDGSFARSARYPSDWDFSVDQARAVRDALRDLGIETVRLTYDGRAHIEPLSVDGQPRTAWGDGRVEIVLLAGR